MTAKYELTLTGLTDEVVGLLAARILGVKTIALSPTEIRIAKLMGQGVSQQDIAARLGLRNKSDCHNRVREVCKRHEITRYQLAVYGAFISMHAKEM